MRNSQQTFSNYVQYDKTFIFHFSQQLQVHQPDPLLAYDSTHGEWNITFSNDIVITTKTKQLHSSSMGITGDYHRFNNVPTGTSCNALANMNYKISEAALKVLNKLINSLVDEGAN